MTILDAFAAEARAAILLGQHEARESGRSYLGSDHVLLGLVQTEWGPVRELFRDYGLTADAARVAMAELSGSRPLVNLEEKQALLSLGIGVDRIRERAEALFGPGALDRRPAPARPSRRWWRRGDGPPCRNGETGPGFLVAPELKAAFESSTRWADSLEAAAVGPEHLLLGATDAEDSAATAVLLRLGIDIETLRQRLRALLRDVA